MRHALIVVATLFALLACESAESPAPVGAASKCTPAACEDVSRAAQKGSSVLTRTLACCLSLVATACPVQPSPVTPSPSPTHAGGTTSSGGSGGLGGATSTGGVTAFGGATATAPTTSAVQFPVCNPPTHKATPVDRSKLKLGRKRGPLSKARKASYVEAAGVSSAFWPPLIPSAIDQRDLGACTGFATVDARLSKPFALFTLPKPYGEFSTIADFEGLARDIYSGATKRDPWPGSWPPNDTGSNGSSALAEAKSKGVVDSFYSVATLADLQIALQSGPCIAGVDWYDGMFSPDNCGQLSMTGAIAGGHEVAFVGVDVDRKLIWGLNSWGDGFGVRWENHGGYFNLTYGTVSKLLAADGEIECLK